MFDLVLPLVIFLIPLAYSPGPGNLTFAANGARFGFAATLPANLGYHLATWAVTFVLGLGFAATAEGTPAIALAMRLVGAGYVLWLAWGLLRAGVLNDMGIARPMGFGGGIALLLLNPKAYMIIALMFTQFAPQGGPAQWHRIALITTIFTLNNALAFALWTLVGDRIAGLYRDALGAQVLNIGLGILLAGVAVWMLLP